MTYAGVVGRSAATAGGSVGRSGSAGPSVDDHGAAAGRPGRRRAGSVSTTRRGGVGEHVREPVGRVVGSSGTYARAGLEHREQRRPPGPGARSTQTPTSAAGRDAERDQVAGQPVGAARPARRRSPRCPPRPAPTASGVRRTCAATSCGTVRCGTSAPVSFQRTSSRCRSAGVEQVDLRSAGVSGSAAAAVSSRARPPSEPLGGAAVEQVGGVLQVGVEAAGARRRTPERRRSNLAPPLPACSVSTSRPGSAKRASALFCSTSMTWNSGCRASDRGRVQLLDQPLERHVLVGVRGQVRLPDPGQQLAEGRVARGVGAQHQGVDEEPDQVVQRLVGAAGDRRADRDVGAGAQPGQQRGDAGLQHHEQRRAGALARGPAALGGRRRRAPRSTASPPWLETAGRGRSVGSSSWSGAPARASRQYPSCAASRLSGSSAPPSRSCCQSA